MREGYLRRKWRYEHGYEVKAYSSLALVLGRGNAVKELCRGGMSVSNGKGRCD